MQIERDIISLLFHITDRRFGAIDATLQVRMDSQIKNNVEELYHDLGTSFAEAVRIFAQQSLFLLPIDDAAHIRRHFTGFQHKAKEFFPADAAV